ncbi:dTDP-4-dehydrorhamnose reductase [Capnocytophaga sputigena]|jgi:dTDP-4-dehydrorhamnose reductase|uniref:dTDP-4-dehydrorhamnose reductase n=1 Tax=Capnocytophaga sputigena TaxID=1019 RepID=UPI000BB195F3|nr:dTDP-4-dehydrorhamnose reductase [Capnocytophaga sputigena]ATA70338.1 dTDP-4-dehydrorhamnose reductase [Capnocytophaga sputigena]
MNVLVTGANGQLGSEIQNNTHRISNYYFSDADSLDITDARAIRAFVQQHAINLIVNCAAYTNVDKAEDDCATAEAINHTAVAHLASVCKEFQLPLIHISTDYVFGGTKNTPYSETDTTQPLGVYGRTKLAGEQAIQNSGIEHLIIRTSWLYSLRFGNNFVKTIQRLSGERPQLKVVADQVGTPTNAADLADFIVQAIENAWYRGKREVYHFSNEGVCSWYDFAVAIVAASGNVCEVLPCTSAEFPSKVTRPSYSVLDKTKLKTDFGYRIPYWRDSFLK